MASISRNFTVDALGMKRVVVTADPSEPEEDAGGFNEFTKALTDRGFRIGVLIKQKPYNPYGNRRRRGRPGQMGGGPRHVHIPNPYLEVKEVVEEKQPLPTTYVYNSTLGVYIEYVEMSWLKYNGGAFVLKKIPKNHVFASSYDSWLSVICRVRIKECILSAEMFKYNKAKFEMKNSGLLYRPQNITNHKRSKDGVNRLVVEVYSPQVDRCVKFLPTELEFVYPDVDKLLKSYIKPFNRSFREGSTAKVMKKNRLGLDVGTRVTILKGIGERVEHLWVKTSDNRELIVNKRDLYVIKHGDTNIEETVEEVKKETEEAWFGDIVDNFAEEDIRHLAELARPRQRLRFWGENDDRPQPDEFENIWNRFREIQARGVEQAPEPLRAEGNPEPGF